jgi:Kef-type K+ transport system membrane component KefB
MKFCNKRIGVFTLTSLISIWLFNLALICGVITSQILDLASIRAWLFFLTDTLLAYIMIEVGLEFIIQKKKWKSYLLDYGVASLAAGLPWFFCFLYFLRFSSDSWKESLLLARFAAPTATGILFTMLGLAGLGMTWLFRKVEVLVILDDLDTIIFLIPIQFLLSGGRLELIFIAFVMIILLILGWRYMHTLKLPASRPWLFFYALIIGAITEWLVISFGLEIEVLLPAFTLGLILRHPPEKRKESHIHEHAFIEPQKKGGIFADRSIKFLFMFLVGLLLPEITFTVSTLKNLSLHVIAITLLMNLGKLAPIFFYKKEATLRKRIAVSVSMMPRGEIGAGILSIALGHGIKGLMAQAATLSLAFNMFLTGFFIWIVMWLLKDKEVKS